MTPELLEIDNSLGPNISLQVSPKRKLLGVSLLTLAFLTYTYKQAFIKYSYMSLGLAPNSKLKEGDLKLTVISRTFSSLVVIF